MSETVSWSLSEKMDIWRQLIRLVVTYFITRWFSLSWTFVLHHIVSVLGFWVVTVAELLFTKLQSHEHDSFKTNKQTVKTSCKGMVQNPKQLLFSIRFTIMYKWVAVCTCLIRRWSVYSVAAEAFLLFFFPFTLDQVLSLSLLTLLFTLFSFRKNIPSALKDIS